MNETKLSKIAPLRVFRDRICEVRFEHAADAVARDSFFTAMARRLGYRALQ